MDLPAMSAAAAPGTLWGVGVGPGDPELLTLKAVRLIRTADVLAYPAPDVGDSFARRIAAPHIPGHAPEVAIRIPMQASRFPAREAYDRAVETLTPHLAAGRSVVVLCEGDPFLYGSFMYLFERFEERFPTAIVPGVSSILAGAAAARLPLVARTDTLAVLPGTLPDAALSAGIAAADAVAILKLGRHLDRIRALLDGMGLMPVARYVERATLPDQRILPLEAVEGPAPYFAMILLHRRGSALA